ncbi:MAG: MotA/TolQ/ExbB proton channel family protein [Pirellulaceae bacterium]|nr:MotA/TolQ/ExbB proton channel family protein [Pirellulaceae bacterium]
MDASVIYNWVGFFCYFLLAAVAAWGAYFVVLVLSRISSKRFKSEDAQDAFLDSIEPALRGGNFTAVQQQCEGDKRALPMMVNLACANRKMGFGKTQQYVLDRFQRDVIADLDVRVAWVITVIKTAPMLGLFGTVIGMMGAFGKLASSVNVNPTDLAGDIRVALETTAIGLSIAIPLVMCMASITNRIKIMQDLAATGLNRFFDAFREGLNRDQQTGNRSRE